MTCLRKPAQKLEPWATQPRIQIPRPFRETHRQHEFSEPNLLHANLLLTWDGGVGGGGVLRSRSRFLFVLKLLAIVQPKLEGLKPNLLHPLIYFTTRSTFSEGRLDQF